MLKRSWCWEPIVLSRNAAWNLWIQQCQLQSETCEFNCSCRSQLLRRVDFIFIFPPKQISATFEECDSADDYQFFEATKPKTDENDTTIDSSWPSLLWYWIIFLFLSHHCFLIHLKIKSWKPNYQCINIPGRFKNNLSSQIEFVQFLTKKITLGTIST